MLSWLVGRRPTRLIAAVSSRDARFSSRCALAGDRSPLRRYAAAGLDAAARRSRRRRMTVGALEETEQEKQGSSTAGVQRQYTGYVGRVADKVEGALSALAAT